MSQFQRYTTRVGAAGLAQFQDSRLRQAGMIRPDAPTWVPNPTTRYIILTDGKPDHENNFVDKEDAQDHIVSYLRKRFPGPKYSYRKANKRELRRILMDERGEMRSLERAESATDRYYDDRGSWRDNPRLKKVPEHMKETSRKKAEGVYVFPKRKSYPIGDLYHARKALLQSMWPNNLKKAPTVLQAIVATWPQYNWKAYWNKEAKEAKNSRSIPSYDRALKAGRGSWEQWDTGTKYRNPAHLSRLAKSVDQQVKDQIKWFSGEGKSMYQERGVRRELLDMMEGSQNSDLRYMQQKFYPGWQSKHFKRLITQVDKNLSRSNPALKFKRQTDGSYLSSGKGESYFIKKERVTSKGRRKTMYALHRLTHSYHPDRWTPARSWRLVAHYRTLAEAKKAAGASPGRFNPAHEIKSKKKSSSRRNPMATKSPFVKAGEMLKRLSPRAKLSNYPTLAKRKSRIKELRAQGRRANPVAINPTKRKKNPIKRKNSRTVHTAMKKADYMERLKNLGISGKSRRESLYQKYLKKMKAESVKRRTRSKSRRR